MLNSTDFTSLQGFQMIKESSSKAFLVKLKVKNLEVLLLMYSREADFSRDSFINELNKVDLSFPVFDLDPSVFKSGRMGNEILLYSCGGSYNEQISVVDECDNPPQQVHSRSAAENGLVETLIGRFQALAQSTFNKHSGAVGPVVTKLVRNYRANGKVWWTPCFQKRLISCLACPIICSLRRFPRVPNWAARLRILSCGRSLLILLSSTVFLAMLSCWSFHPDCSTTMNSLLRLR